MNNKSTRLVLGLLAVLLLLGLCGAGTTLLFGSGLVWYSQAEREVTPTRRIRSLASLPTAPPNTATPTHTASPIPSPSPTATASPTAMASPPPPTDTPLPSATPTEPATATPRPPTATPPPTETPTPLPPAYPFEIKETARFGTSHDNFDVYVAITNENNRPLRDYRIIGTHSSGLQIESPASAGDWTANSGAMHYKAGNIKYAVPQSPTGMWTLQLVNPEGQPVAPPVEFPFDAADPNWYFLLYQAQDSD